MSTQMRPPRTRSTGGRTLMLLGVLLALAAGTIVIYVVSSAVGPTTHTTMVVVANEDIASGTILSATTSDTAHTLISAAFVAKPVNSDFVPTDALPYTDVTQLNLAINDKVVIGSFYKGDILRKDDPRLAAAGAAGANSLTLIQPDALPKGDVLFPLQAGGIDTGALVAGDRIDILATYCVTSVGSGSGCVGGSDQVQTTFQNLYVYTIKGGTLYVVVSHQDALVLKYVEETGKLTAVLRKPGDTDPAITSPVNGSYIYQHFHFSGQ